MLYDYVGGFVKKVQTEKVNTMSDLSDRMIALRERCLRCWADEFSDIFPQGRNLKIAGEEMKKYGNPGHSERCEKEKVGGRVVLSGQRGSNE